jgi:hypothetical protein
MAINASWHRKHPMPERPSPEQRLRWHLAHARACGCRKLSASFLRELRRRVAERAARKRT